MSTDWPGACPHQLLLCRVHLLFTRFFVTAEDWRLGKAMEVWVEAFGELKEDMWALLQPPCSVPRCL